MDRKAWPERSEGLTTGRKGPGPVEA
jgi:hypothetical protein